MSGSTNTWHPALVEKALEFVERHRAGKQKTLDVGAAEVLENATLLLGFHADGDDTQLKPLSDSADLFD